MYANNDYRPIAFVLLTAGFRLEVAVNYALLGYYAASGGNFLPMFRDNLSFPLSGFKNPNKKEKIFEPWLWDTYIVPKRR